MRLPRARLIAASAAVLAMGVGTPALLAASASAATAPGSAATAAASTAAPKITEPVTGTFKNAAGTGTFSGTFKPTSFGVRNGVLDATGLLTGTLTSATGASLGSVAQTATLPVATSGASGAAAHPAATCNVLNLVLGPLNLNLLGLVVTLNQVNLNITAVTGSLLGNLLCDVSGLLNGGGALSSISTLLNEILALL